MKSTTMSAHGRVLCSCGKLIMHCRCFQHHEPTVLQDACEECRLRKESFEKQKAQCKPGLTYKELSEYVEGGGI